jgi:hypothetical protein
MAVAIVSALKVEMSSTGTCHRNLIISSEITQSVDKMCDKVEVDGRPGRESSRDEMSRGKNEE